MAQVGKAKLMSGRKDLDGVFHNHAGATSRRNRARHTRAIERSVRQAARKACKEID
jgi:hypothetical protein